MLGILIGTACLIGLIKVARHGHYSRRCGGGGWHGHHAGHCGGGGGFAPRGWDGHHHHHHEGHGDEWGGRGGDRGFGGWGGRGGWRGGFFLRGFFQRLDTSPGQEKAIRAAVEELWTTLRAARGEWTDLSEIATLFTGETFDATEAEGISGKADASFAKVRVAMVEAMRKIHEALDERQRQMLSEWLRSRGGRRGGPSSMWM